jgi:hypothetical protein
MTQRKHIIVRQVTNDSRTPVQLDPSIDLKKIARVHTLLDEKLYREIGTLHWRSTFLEDKMHDWDVRKGAFYFYGHSSEKGDVVDLLLEIEP